MGVKSLWKLLQEEQLVHKWDGARYHDRIIAEVDDKVRKNPDFATVMRTTCPAAAAPLQPSGPNGSGPPLYCLYS
jgi:hypothetical protein